MSSKSPGRKRKSIIYKVLMLDDQEVPFQLEQKTIGLDLVNLVYQYLKLIESDYFSLIYVDSQGKKCWLDYDRAVTKQISPETRLIFCVKFYTPDPGQLEEEYTRYLYALQIKKDLAEGLLLCSDATASLLASYILQAEIGDYNEMYDNNANYFQGRKFFPHQNNDHEMKIIDYHKNHVGQSPGDADLNLLDIARKVELYGIIMHSAKDHEGVLLNLAVAHMGILVFQNYTKINTFSWAKIRKLSFKRRKFLIKLHPENYGFYKDTVEFYLENRDDSKNFWKECIEHHSFFRCVSSSKNINKNNKSKLLTRGSSFRYYGRTQKEVIENARESFPKNRIFDRTYNSMRCISNIANDNLNGTIVNNTQISGTQSLNRNLCSRSSNNKNSSSQSPQIIHTSCSTQSNTNIKSATLRSHDTTVSCNSHLIGETPTTSLLGLDTNNNDNDEDDDDNVDDNIDEIDVDLNDKAINISREQQNNKNIDNNDALTHGSLTIDSRYSNNKMLIDDNYEDHHNASNTTSELKINVNKNEIIDINNITEDDNMNIKPSSFNKLPKFKQQEKLKNNIEQINNALKKELSLNHSQQKSSPNKTNEENTTQTSSPKSQSSASSLSSQQQVIPIVNLNTNSSMNKIISRKEVITIKEETKNIHHEEVTTQQTIYQHPYYLTSLNNNLNNNDNNNNNNTHDDRLKFYKAYDQVSKQQQQLPINNKLKSTSSSLSSPPTTTTSSSSSSATTTNTTLTSTIAKTTSNTTNSSTLINNHNNISNISNNNDDDVHNDAKNPKTIIKQKSLTRKFSPPPVISNKIIISTVKNENNYEDDLPPAPPPPPSSQTYKQPLILDYQDPLNIKYDSTNNQFILPINFEPNVKQFIKSNSLGSNQMNVDDEFKRKKNSNDGSYYIAKELLMTERTYKKDLELIIVHFQNHIKNLNQYSEFLFEIISLNLNPIFEFHEKFLKDLEQRLSFWIDEKQKIGDVLSNITFVLKNYKNYIEKYDEMLNELELICRKNKKFDILYKDFETQKLCYLPLNLFLLKPIQRILHYKLLFEKLLLFHGQKHYDYQDIYSIYMKIEDLIVIIQESITVIENKQKLIELQRELIGAENLVPVSIKLNRFFIREGSLQKLSRKGYQQRMFFLFSDVLLYCARSSNPVLQFKIHGEYPLKSLQIEDGNPRINIPNSFTIYSSNRSILVAAISQEDKIKWFNDINEAIEKFKSSFDEKFNYATIKSNCSSENNLDMSNPDVEEEEEDHHLNDKNIQTNTQQQILNSPSSQQHRSNTTMHVCWHRNISVSANDNHLSVSNQLSGYLLRKFKNTNGWQKLWVVFTNFCLFFYKTYQDDHPLASLPLLGYTVTIPNETDNINKDFVFKLQFKNHVYFFRTDSQYSFDRWLDVISSAAQKI